MIIGFTGHRNKLCSEQSLLRIGERFPGAKWVHGGAGGFDTQVHEVALKLGKIVGAWAAVLVGPDYDLHVNVEQKQQVWRYNRTLGCLWSLYWKPYDWLNSHRGRSHTIPAGTFDRFVLLFWPLLLLSVWFAPAWWLVLWWWLVLCGQCMVDAVHLWLDGLL